MMKLSRWKPRSSLPLSAAILYTLFTTTNGVALTGCSSQNTGTSSTSSNFMTNGLCHDTCSGFAFAITQYQQCWCSNTAPSDQSGTSDCNQPCPGFPSEYCGNKDEGLFGYVALGRRPTATAGGGGGQRSSNDDDSGNGVGETTVVQTSVVVSTRPAPSYSAPAVTPDPITVVQTKTSGPSPLFIQLSSKEAPPTTVESVVKTVTPTPEVLTSARTVTVNGEVKTTFVTSTPVAYASASTLPEHAMPRPTRTGLSNGEVAGITIGVVAGLALLGALLFFLVWRPRRRKRDSENGMKRSSSILSRTGLLRTPTDAGSSAPALVAGSGPTLPRLQTNGIPQGDGPQSAATIGSSEMESKRLSRPMFVDDRLNPNALMQHVNPSRTSIGTLQDNQDYSRPLEVRNPDGR